MLRVSSLRGRALILRPYSFTSIRKCSQTYFGRYMRKILSGLEDPVRQSSSTKKNDFSTPHPPKDPPEPYVPDEKFHEAFDPPRKLPKTVFRKFKSVDEVLGPNADKCKSYKNPEYFSYHRYSFVNLQRASLKLRKERIENQKEAESDAEYDAQLEAEWEAICEQQKDVKCPNQKEPEVKCLEPKKSREPVDELPVEECKKEDQNDKVEECEHSPDEAVKITECMQQTREEELKAKEEDKETEECRKKLEEECRKARQQKLDEAACKEAEEARIEEEKKQKRKARKKLEAECRKRAEEKLKAVYDRIEVEKRTEIDGEQKENKARELELKKLIVKCKQEIMQKKRIEEKCTRVAEQTLREEKCRKEMERKRNEINEKNEAAKMEEEKRKQDESKLKAYKEECLKSKREELEKLICVENIAETDEDKDQEKLDECEKKESDKKETTKQCMDNVPADVVYLTGATVSDKKCEGDAAPSECQTKEDDK